MQDVKVATTPITFAVDAVSCERKPLTTVPLSASLPARLGRPVLLVAEPGRSVVKTYCDPHPGAGRVAFPGIHPFVDAVHHAFASHYPLVLSPDAIWLVIEQGFAKHIRLNAEQFRHRLVTHEGKRELTTTLENLTSGAFENAIADFSRQIREASDPGMHETLLCDFTTTTPAIRTASEVVLMDTYSPYFVYMLQCVCGIPSIIMTGSPEDWQRIRERVEVLATFDLEWWVARLRPILDEFVNTSQGRPDPQFWQAIYKPKKTYGAETVTGWLADLFPYLDDQRSHVFEQVRVQWEFEREEPTVSRRFDPGANKGVAPSRFPSGLCSVPVRVMMDDTSGEGLDLMAGFLAFEQDPQTLAVAPVISWAVAVPPPSERVLAIW